MVSSLHSRTAIQYHVPADSYTMFLSVNLLLLLVVPHLFALRCRLTPITIRRPSDTTDDRLEQTVCRIPRKSEWSWEMLRPSTTLQCAAQLWSSKHLELSFEKFTKVEEKVKFVKVQKSSKAALMSVSQSRTSSEDQSILASLRMSRFLQYCQQDVAYNPLLQCSDCGKCSCCVVKCD